MRLIVPLLASLLSTTLASYVIQQELTNNYLFVDVPRSSATSANAFLAPRKDIVHTKTRHMFFDLVPVGDAYKIVDVITGMSLYGPPARGLQSVFGEPVMAKKNVRIPGDFGLWHLSPSSKAAVFVVNKRTKEFLTAYRRNILDADYPPALTSFGSGVNVMRGSKWIIRKAEKLD